MTSTTIKTGEDRGYPGSKAGAGVWQKIISEMPPHDLYIEPFAGSAQVFRRKRPSPASIVIDTDAAVVQALTAAFGEAAGISIICDDGPRWLLDNLPLLNTRTVVYCDPPYLYSTLRNPARRYFKQPFGEDLHERLLLVLSELTLARVPVLLSGYRSPLYDQRLKKWRRLDYTAQTRGGPRTESLWCNFDPPWSLHDYRYLGANFRERERIKRKKQRWRQKLLAMPLLERAAVLATINELAAVHVKDGEPR